MLVADLGSRGDDALQISVNSHACGLLTQITHVLSSGQRASLRSRDGHAECILITKYFAALFHQNICRSADEEYVPLAVGGDVDMPSGSCLADESIKELTS